MDIKAMLASIFTLPQTQKDISQIASMAQQAQSPQMQAQLSQAQADLTTAIGTQLTLQFISTAALVGIFVLLYKKA
jgi:hypothetical protein